jgi:hypothetical protein
MLGPLQFWAGVGQFQPLPGFVNKILSTTFPINTYTIYGDFEWVWEEPSGLQSQVFTLDRRVLVLF